MRGLPEARRGSPSPSSSCSTMSVVAVTVAVRGWPSSRASSPMRLPGQDGAQVEALPGGVGLALDDDPPAIGDLVLGADPPRLHAPGARRSRPASPPPESSSVQPSKRSSRLSSAAVVGMVTPSGVTATSGTSRWADFRRSGLCEASLAPHDATRAFRAFDGRSVASVTLRTYCVDHRKVHARAPPGLPGRGLRLHLSLVGVAGFEPTTSSSRTKRAAKLRYTPMAASRRRRYFSPPAAGDEIRFFGVLARAGHRLARPDPAGSVAGGQRQQGRLRGAGEADRGVAVGAAARGDVEVGDVAAGLVGGQALDARPVSRSQLVTRAP